MEEYRAYVRYLQKALVEERKRADDRQAENVVLYVLLVALTVISLVSFIR